MSSTKNISVLIPVSDRTASDSDVVFFPDELPEDFHILLDVLIAALAPLEVWKACAVS